ncbi:MAG: hypothetical protein NTV94_14145, partial [Planctomycetota bacterium]|nr:hypothetical protein [Planctomycetota bacterium]
VVAWAGTAMADTVIDGSMTSGEWAGATTYTIGNGGGMAYFRADTSYVYAAFDVTGWTAAMGASSQGNLLGFGVWKANNSYGASGTGVEFQQSTTDAAWGGGSSGTMNGLVSAYRLNTAIQGSINANLQAADSFATGHRVWEVKVPISSMGVNAGDTIWLVGGINYNGQQHWYPDSFVPGYSGYAPLEVGPLMQTIPLPPAAWAGLSTLAGIAGIGFIRRRRQLV